jgi:hypothetical protein
MSNNYLIKALRAFRTETYGQFDQVTKHVVEETQDAADEIERLNARIAELEKGLVVSLDGSNTTSGMTGGLRWADVAKLVEEKEAGFTTVTFMPKTDGLYYVVERK